MVSRLLARASILLGLSILLLAVTRCEKRKGTHSPSPKTGTSTSTAVGQLPTGWNGETDFANSAFEVIDE